MSEWLRLLIIAGACTAAYMVLGLRWWRLSTALCAFLLALVLVSSPTSTNGWLGAVEYSVVFGTGSVLIDYWVDLRVKAGHRGYWGVGRKARRAPGADSGARPGLNRHAARRVWRIHWSMRAASVVFPVAVLPLAIRPDLMDPSWRADIPIAWWLGVGLAYAGMGLVAWAVLRSRIEVADGQVRVVNPLRTHRFARSEVKEVRPHPLGVGFLLHKEKVVVGFAIQPIRTYLGPVPRWVDVAFTVTGEEPPW